MGGYVCCVVNHEQVTGRRILCDRPSRNLDNKAEVAATVRVRWQLPAVVG